MDFTHGDYYVNSGSGAVWTFYGPFSAGTYDSLNADSTLTGNSTYDYFGRTSAAVDANDDGIDDLAVSQYGLDSVYIYAGGGM